MTNLTDTKYKDIFRAAYESRYTWDRGFNGFQGKCIAEIGENVYQGKFILGQDFKPEIQKIDNEEIVKSISSQLFEVSIHRVKRDFESIHSKNDFNLLKSSENGIEMSVSGKNDGDKYRVKDKCINMVYRKIHGTIIEIFVQEFTDTGMGFLSSKYSSQQIDPETLSFTSPKLNYHDQFINIDHEKNIWLLHSRTIHYLNKNRREESQRFIFEDLSLLG